MTKLIALVALLTLASGCAVAVDPTPTQPVDQLEAEPNCAPTDSDTCSAAYTPYQCVDASKAILAGQNVTGLQDEAIRCFASDETDLHFCCTKG